MEEAIFFSFNAVISLLLRIFIVRVKYANFAFYLLHKIIIWYGDIYFYLFSSLLDRSGRYYK
jgi:hypothetical protein